MRSRWSRGAVAQEHHAAFDAAADALPRHRLESLDSGQCQSAVPGRPDDRLAQGMLGADLDSGGQPQDVLLGLGGQRNDVGDVRLAPGERARLVEHHRRELAGALEHLRTADEDSHLRTLADPDHQCGRGRDAERTRAGDDEHCDECEQPLREVAREPPPGKCQDCHADHDRDEVARHLVGEALYRRRAGLGLFDELDDLGKRGIGADPRGLDPQHAGAVQRAADHGGTRNLFDRHGTCR